MNGYYSFQLRVPQVVTLTYNLSVEVKQVDVDALNGTILETIYPDSDDQITEISWASIGTNLIACV